MAFARPQVAFLILNWNKWEITVECLESVIQNRFRDYEVVLVENGSKNDSFEKILSYCRGELETSSPFFKYSNDSKPLPVRTVKIKEDGSFQIEEGHGPMREGPGLTLIKVEENQGYAEGNNIGIRFISQHVDPQYVLFMNNDVVVDPDFLSPLVDRMKATEDVAMAAPKIKYYELNGSSNIINCAGCFLDMTRVRSQRRGRDEEDRGQYDIEGMVDFADGACFLMRMSVLNVTGGFDRSFFTYWEETDLSIRTTRLGHKIIYVPRSVVWHRETYSIVTESKEYYMVRNRYKFIRKNGTRWQANRFMAYHLLVLLVPTVLVYVRDGETQRVRPFLKGTVDGVRTLMTHSEG